MIVSRSRVRRKGYLRRDKVPPLRSADQPQILHGVTPWDRRGRSSKPLSPAPDHPSLTFHFENESAALL
jgi:hypothetical protein